jgi:hypothetical protein
MDELFVSIPVPIDLTSVVMRLVADHLDGAQTGPHSRGDEPWGPRDLWAGYVDDADSAMFWSQVIRPVDRRLLRFLAAQPAPTPAADVAHALGFDVAALAGVVGPLNKGCLAAGFPVPVVSQTVTSTTPDGRRRVRMLSIPTGLAEVVRSNDSGEDKPETRSASVRRRSPSKASMALRERQAADHDNKTGRA